MTLIEVCHESGTLSSYASEVVPRVGETISFTGGRHDCRKVVRVDYEVYVTTPPTVGQLEHVRVFVE